MNKLIQFFGSKNKSEIFILIFIALLAIVTIVYANMLANRLDKKEESEVILWAKAISEKAKVLKLSNEVFRLLASEERKKVEINYRTTEFLLSENNNEILSYLLFISESNNQIPIIITDASQKILTSRNVENIKFKNGIVLSKTIHPEYFKYQPIVIDLHGKKNYLYYRESKIYQKLSEVLKASGNQFVDEITNNTSMLPVILLDKNQKIQNYGNIPKDIANDKAKFARYVTELKSSNKPIIIDIDPKNKQYLYYQKSNISTYIKWFPVGLYSILGMMLLLTFSAIKNTRNFEKNQIWVGMSKETAHQLGTPISSLGAWLEVIETADNLPESQLNVVEEMKKDVNRLTLIADRFSKIGSKPKLEQVQLEEIIDTCFDYLKNRASKRVIFTMDQIDPSIYVKINRQLFEWVIENMVKNAFDAISNEGKVHIGTKLYHDKLCIDVSDSGKGILPKDVESIFEPGFTTKKRGWGLGLSLCKRIIVDYFDGKIYVHSSKINSGTILRIELKPIIESIADTII